MNITVYALDKGLSLRALPGLPADRSLDAVSQRLPQGVYSTFRTYAAGQKVLGLRAHLDRLFGPAAAQGLQPSVSAEELRQGLRQLLDASRPNEARVRISLALTEQPGQVFVMLEPLKLLDEKVYQFGVKVVTSNAERVNPRLKSTAFIQKSADERKTLLSLDVFEGLIVKNGFILEGMTSNFYALQNSKIITARQGILLGVTRRVVLKLLRTGGIEIEYRPLRMAELAGIDEAFITSSSRGVVPVVRVDGSPVGRGQPGALAKRLRGAYDAYVLQMAESI
jgi:branched-chain amino acid aminotransferase